MNKQEEFLNACTNGDVKYIDSIINNDEKTNYNYYGCFINTIINDKLSDINTLEVIKKIMPKGINEWNRGLEWAAVTNKSETAKYMIEKGANRFNESLKLACYSLNIDMVKLLLEYGANNYDDALKTICLPLKQHRINKPISFTRLDLPIAEKYAGDIATILYIHGAYTGYACDFIFTILNVSDLRQGKYTSYRPPIINTLDENRYLLYTTIWQSNILIYSYPDIIKYLNNYL